MGTEKRPSVGRCTREPFLEGKPDPGELRCPPRHGDDGELELSVDRVQVEDVEPPDDRAIEQHGPHPFERIEALNQRDDLTSAVGAVPSDPSRSNGLDMLGQSHHYGGDRRVLLATVERPVIDAHDLWMRFPQRAPQR